MELTQDSIDWTYGPIDAGTLGCAGIIFGRSAFNILYNYFNGVIDHKMDEIHLKLDSIQFESIKVHQNHNFKIKKFSNCKLLLHPSTSDPKYFLYRKEMLYSTTDFFEMEIMVNSTKQKIKIENVIDTQINVLLGPLLNLRRCESLNEALMCWSLNGHFLKDQDYITLHKGTCQPFLAKIVNNDILKEKLRWFLTNDNVLNFVPKQFINKVKKIHNTFFPKKGPKEPKNFETNLIKFMDVLTNTNKYFIKKVRSYFINEKISLVTSFDLNFEIELYGENNHISCVNTNTRTSLFLTPKNKDSVHFKSTAILFNLRWFFNTRNNNQQSFGLDGEYGYCTTGYGQTFHKYDDVILWLVTHPNTVDEVEFVILDPIPLEYQLCHRHN